MAKKRSETSHLQTFPTNNIQVNTKKKVGSLSVLRKKTENLNEVPDNFAEMKETTMTKKVNNPRNSNRSSENKNNCSEASRKEIESKLEIPTRKRKRYNNQTENIEDPSSKKLSGTGGRPTGISQTISSSKVDKRLSQIKKKKRKPRESCWENKLTGARRVSKRLSNLRIEKLKSLKDLGSSTDKLQVSIGSKQPFNFSTRGRMKASKELDGNSCKKSKSSYKRNRAEAQNNFGKLNYTKRLYPKISAGRRPATYTVTIKPADTIRQNSMKRNENYEIFTDNSCDEDDYDVDSLINKCVEEIEDVIVSETKDKELSESNITQEVKNSSNDQLKVSESAEESSDEAIPQKNEVQTLVCSNIDEEFSDSSTVIVDIEASENIVCGIPVVNHEQSSESGRNDEEKKLTEQLPKVEELSDLEHKTGSIIDLKDANSEEKGTHDEKKGLDSSVTEMETKKTLETSEKKVTSTGQTSRKESILTETTDISKNADLVE